MLAHPLDGGRLTPDASCFTPQSTNNASTNQLINASTPNKLRINQVFERHKRIVHNRGSWAHGGIGRRAGFRILWGYPVGVRLPLCPSTPYNPNGYWRFPQQPQKSRTNRFLGKSRNKPAKGICEIWTTKPEPPRERSILIEKKTGQAMDEVPVTDAGRK